MTKSVLDVGNCAADHGAIQRLIESQFDATVNAAQDQESALSNLRGQHYDLVLINRIMDWDGSSGLELIEAIQSDDQLDVPVMLISNYQQHQQRAIELGASPGFGKAELSSPQTIERLGQWLK